MRRDGREGRARHPRQVVNDPLARAEFRRKARLVAAAVLITVAVSGFFMGLRSNRSEISLSRPVETMTPDSVRRVVEAPAGITGAVRYSEVDRRKSGANAGWVSNVADLRPPAAEPTSPGNSPTQPISEADRTAALALRAIRRAFDGAPPTVPHPIQQESPAGCLACHAQGLVVKDRIASKISHPHYANCTQCHVPALGPGIPYEAWLTAPFTTSTFVGSTPQAGTRAQPDAAPTIPHPTAMRSDCLSCHGPNGAQGLRTPHPNRQSCVQCHAPSAELEQRAFLTHFVNDPAPRATPTR